MDDLPVAVALEGPLGDEVAAWVERDLGWQVVEPGGALVPVLGLSDRPLHGSPWIAIVAESGDEAAALRLLADGAEDVVSWPDERDRIPMTAARLDPYRRPITPRRRIEVGGATGGAGATTLALALGGVLAWRGASVLVVGDGDVLDFAGAQNARGASGAYVDVAGVTNLSVARRDVSSRMPNETPVEIPWAGDVVVVDTGAHVAPYTDVVVTRPDIGLRRAARSSASVVVNGSGPVSDAQVRRILGDAIAAQLPWSARVAHAALRGRLPAGLPGTWLRTLAGCIEHLTGQGSR